MAQKTTVTLGSNGRYWQAHFYDLTGKRRAKSLGAKSEISRRQAKVLCDRLAAQHQLNPTSAGQGRAPTLQEYLQRYLESRADLRPGTRELHERTRNYLLSFFGSEVRIDKISRAGAADWQAALSLGNMSRKKRPSEPTVCQHIRNAKVMFNYAVRDDLILFNPFDRLKGNPSQRDTHWRYVTRDELNRLLEACPSTSWQLLLALCRLAGLRQGEALGLLWTAIDWENHRLDIIAGKTNRRRVIPIDSVLYNLLLKVFSAISDGEQWVIPEGSIQKANLWRDFGVICKRAGLERWADWCQVLRRNCETDWAQHFPQYAVSCWMGHDITVSARHYLQVPQELYDSAAILNSPKTVTKTVTK